MIRTLAFLLLALGSLAQAQTFNLQNINADDYSKIVDNISADFTHTSVSGASPLGHVFGFEVGLVGGKTMTPDLNNVVHKSDPSVDVSSLPAAEILGVLTVPFGITGEIGLVPKIGNKDFHFNSLSLAGKWTASELLDLPFSLAVKLGLTSAKFTSEQVISNVNTTYTYKAFTSALTVLVSKDFAIVEPYFGLGLVNGKGDLDVSGVAAFDSSFTASQSASAKRSSTQMLAGVELKLMVVKLGAEYSHLFGANRYMGKLSFYF